jgi:TonB-dependent SusC/RagA subfamily outer membrane receptor
MKKLLLNLVAFFLLTTLSAQDLVRSRTAGYYTFIYKITNEEASRFYHQEDAPVKEEYFHTVVDFFPTDSVYRKTLSTGHYLFVKSAGASLECALESVNNLEMNILNNHRDLILLFHDRKGEEVKSLRPQLGVRKIPYSEKLNAYRIGTTNRRGMIAVEYEGHVSFFSIDRRHNNTLPARTKRRVLGTFPINHILSPVFYITRTIRGLFDYPHISPPGIYYRAKRIFSPKTFDGYPVLNKPKYKPGDTVRLKAYVTTKKGKPVTKDVKIFLSGYSSRSFYKEIGSVKPYRPGAYVFDFILNDSLKLALDYSYSIILADQHGNHYPTGRFSFEQYELKQNFFSIRSGTTPTHKPATLFLKGTDANDLPLYDVQVELIITSRSVESFYKPSVFIKDTLWVHKFKLDPLGETKVALPDSIFPNASFEYNATPVFINAENERHVKEVPLHYTAQAPLAESTVKNDSVTFFATSSPAERFLLQAFNRANEVIHQQKITVPYMEKLNPHVAYYRLLQHEKVVHYCRMDEKGDQVEVMAQRTQDSLFIATQNPRKLTFRYQLFRNNKIIESGHGLSYSVKRSADAHDRYYLSIQYVWADEARDQNFDLPFAKKPLNISIDHPATVFPGQTADFTINVKDAFNKPVADVDLTAYATTRKFREVSDAYVPRFERFKSRKIFNEFHPRDRAFNLTARLDYDFWRKRLGLDSLAYYQFLYPEHGMSLHYVAAEDSVTQVAPFVVLSGKLQQPYYIYFGNTLKYYSGAESITPYSFASAPGKITITMRLRYRLLTIKDVIVEKGKKLILSIDLNHLPAGVEATDVKPAFTEVEAKKVSSHFLLVNREANQGPAYLQQGDVFHVLQPLPSWQSKWGERVGPFLPGPVTYHSSFTAAFDFKANSRYIFKPGVTEREPGYSINSRYGRRSPYHTFNPSLRDQVQTARRVQEFLRKQEREKVYTVRKYPNYFPVAGAKGRLNIVENYSTHLRNRFATFIINLDVPDEYYIFPGQQTEYGPLLPGLYQVVLIYNDESYLKPPPVRVDPYGRTFYDLKEEVLHAADTFSHEVMMKVKTWSTEYTYVESSRAYDMQNLRQLYYRESAQDVTYNGGRWVTGVINDETGQPVPGVNIIVKGTMNGTATDMNGGYRIYVPHGGVLIISFIGYQTEEIETGSRTEIDATLAEDVKQLSEVVVVGYGAQSHKMLSGVVAGSLQGRTPGISFLSGGAPGAADSVDIKIRGASTIGSDGPILVIIDGVVKTMDDIDRDKITSIEVLKSAQAVALYGSRASNGVMLISTKPGMTRSELLKTKLPEVPMLVSGEASPGSSLRKNFRDYAFWKPRLSTDANGDAKFSATFPDDITGWNVQVLGMASRKRTGEASGKVQSFKPLAAQLALPNFLVQGDTAYALGKITNYSPDSLVIRRTISIADKSQVADGIEVKNSMIDSLTLVAQSVDSIAVKYAIEYRKYEDGELRKIPVFPIGAKESKGFFAALPRDTSFTMSFDRSMGKVKLYAQADMLDVLLDEIEALKNYPYTCNEQMASKLKALLAEKMIREYRNEKFRENDLIEKLIKKLTANQHTSGGWSWWGMNHGNPWITLHVAEALLWSTQQGFSAKFDAAGLKIFLTEKTMPSSSVGDQLKSWLFLSESGEPIAARPIIDSLERRHKLTSVYYKLLAQRVLQLQTPATSSEKSAVDWKWIEAQKRETLKGNWYWGEETNSLHDNDIDNTLRVYQLMKHRDEKDPNLLKLQHYFLEKRRRGWRNTYESSRIIETILPGLLKQQKREIKPTLTLNGGETIGTFPFEKEMDNIQSLSIAKAGSAPVYFTAYQETWNGAPEKVAKDLIVKTSWRDVPEKLKAGKPVKLRVVVEVKKDASYVMISVPIPGGCSYNSKPQNSSNGEVHREYDVHETRIYCENLRAGTYEYTIELLPRFKGSYQLNPAKIEWMYFPVIFGREGMKRVEIAAP